jgi:hypothetical protein
MRENDGEALKLKAKSPQEYRRNMVIKAEPDHLRKITSKQKTPDECHTSCSSKGTTNAVNTLLPAVISMIPAARWASCNRVTLITYEDTQSHMLGENSSY